MSCPTRTARKKTDHISSHRPRVHNDESRLCSELEPVVLTTTLLSRAVRGGGTLIEERDSDAEKVARIKLEREATTALAAANRSRCWIG